MIKILTALSDDIHGIYKQFSIIRQTPKLSLLVFKTQSNSSLIDFTISKYGY